MSIPVIHHANEGHQVELAGIKLFVKAAKEHTNGSWSLIEYHAPAQFAGPPPHYHKIMEETFYVLEGVLTVKINDKISEYHAGSYVLVPRATPHGQGNFSKKPVKFILTVTPGGYERRFRERIELYKTTKPGDPDFQKKLVESRGNVDSEVLGVWDVQK